MELAHALQKEGFEVWLDDWCLEIGASLSLSIEAGLRDSRYAVVVLSKSFFAKKWPRQELSALMEKESLTARVIFPIWHRVTADDVRTAAPLLADRLAARSEEGVSTIVSRLARALNLGKRIGSDKTDITWESLTTLTDTLFPGLGLDEFWQSRLLADLDDSMFRSIGDIERAVRRAERAVCAFAAEQPHLFHSGTDYLTKSLGFVDLCFRRRHSWASSTMAAFEEHANKVEWDS